MLAPLDWPNGRLVEALGNAPRATVAYRELLRRGSGAISVIRQGLHHVDAAVREQCCRLLDQLLVEDAFGEMVAMLHDVDAGVRVAAVHALACDRCKPDKCRPDEAAVLAPGLRLLEADSDPHVRAMAVELVGRFVHSSADAVQALVRVAEGDSSPAVRKKARWYSPGGPIFRRTAPRTNRTLNASGEGRPVTSSPLQTDDHLARFAPSVSRR
jgi:hypothetical protein